ncbi:DUF2835 domain-containing protein [Halomonas sp. 141]|uniref:DUF2835 family protein n=1 Tax=unclassified Halomonas TaxID=2609666 RepID=UPI0009C11D79|nr:MULTISPECIES: DUF2835 family protein [unclassified Halomonas]PJX13213.1 DUF2835 domain-containing protein [Halomonas sp. 141]
MPSIDVMIHLTAAECLAHYEGQYDNVRVRSVDGRWVVFPATALRRVVGRDGVNGVFRLFFTEQGKFHDIVPLAPHA